MKAVLEVHGESDERQRFVYDSDNALRSAIEMMDGARQALRRLHEVGYGQIIEEFGFADDETSGEQPPHRTGPSVPKTG